MKIYRKVQLGSLLLLRSMHLRSKALYSTKCWRNQGTHDHCKTVYNGINHISFEEESHQHSKHLMRSQTIHYQLVIIVLQHASTSSGSDALITEAQRDTAVPLDW